ncbi:MAG TPA: PKD domain-containing protein, partial [Candidatus Thermoplasmatota archaeon]|nr:PKD domain-containing protein [Candidatus Thermoplasmatota archaeon]
MSARASRALVALAVCLLVPPLPPVGSQTADDARPLEEIVHIDVARVRAALAAGQPVPLPLSEGELLLELAPADLFGPGYAPEPQLVRALPYAGSVRGVEGSVARLTVTELWVAGMVSRPGHPLLFVEPLERETLDSRHRVYEARDPIPHHEHPAAPAEDGLGDDPLGPGPEHDCGPLALLCVIDPNDSPGRPGTPNGPSSGTTDTSYAFSTSATDADGDLLTYEFDWGDGRRTTAGPAASGSSVSASQSWSVPRSYCVSVRATDAHGAASDWSSCRTVAIAFPPPNDCATGGDAGDAFSSASLIGPFGSIWCSADLRPSVSDTNDYYRFAVGLNRRITASVEPSTSPCVDHNLYLYDPSGNLRASSTRGGCLADSVTFDNTVSGEWRVRASAATTQDARYSLSISIGSAPNVFPPNTPSSPSPADSATGTPTSPTLSFAGGDPDGNLVVYTVYLDTSSFPTTERCSFTTASSSATCAVSGLASGTTYRWRVTAYDGANFVSGPT